LQVFGHQANPFQFNPEIKALIRRCFQQRRKQLGAFLRAHLPPKSGMAWLAEIEAAGFGPQARAEQIPVALWQKLRVT
jgi:16S rRNA (adenine1518-N6/adenine1519-N6)-dimethyltransferase